MARSYKRSLHLVCPLMLSSCLQLLFNAADVIVVGRFAGSTSLAAVGSTTELLSLLTTLFIGFSIGDQCKCGTNPWKPGRSGERKMASTQPSVSVFYLALP